MNDRLLHLVDDTEFDRITKHARKRSRFYQKWLPDAGQVPLLSRSLVEQNNDLMLDGRPVMVETSGTSGTAIQMTSDPERQAISRREMMHLNRAWDITDSNTTYLKWCRGAAPRRNEMEVASTNDLDNKVFFERWEFIRELNNPNLVSYPSLIYNFARQYLAGTLTAATQFEFVKQIVFIGEPLHPWQTKAIHEAFPNAVLRQTYSAMEFGLIGWSCCDLTSHLRLASDKLGIEVLHDGRVVITDYFNRWMPMIRYAIGDIAGVGKCHCGETCLIRPVGIGRGAFAGEDGIPHRLDEVGRGLQDIEAIRQWQLRQTPEGVTLAVVTSSEFDSESARLAGAIVTGALGIEGSGLRIKPVEAIRRAFNCKLSYVK